MDRNSNHRNKYSSTAGDGDDDSVVGLGIALAPVAVVPNDKTAKKRYSKPTTDNGIYTNGARGRWCGIFPNPDSFKCFQLLIFNHTIRICILGFLATR
mmetsp:Transcript_13108/g.32003  ORF Transcript_13108/g.32003 Transcript_13108/m.32003 type:complete len:98 (-) Transcript_13108:2341-2634(-)